jgi:hypothetical protein
MPEYLSVAQSAAIFAAISANGADVKVHKDFQAVLTLESEGTLLVSIFAKSKRRGHEPERAA